MANETALTVRQKGELLQSMLNDKGKLAELASVMPRIGVTPEALARTALTAVYNNPQLLECDRGSIWRCVVQAAEHGLSFTLGRAYMVPFRNKKKNRLEAQYIPGYLGLLELARRSSDVGGVVAEAVFEGDHFVYRRGLKEDVLEHVSAGETDPKKLTHAYCIVRLTNGEAQFKVMTRNEIEKHRAFSRRGDDGPWVQHYTAMAIKTAVKQALKFCPMSVELAAALALDDAQEAGRAGAFSMSALDGIGDGPDVIDIEAEEATEEPTPADDMKAKLQAKKQKKQETADAQLMTAVGILFDDAVAIAGNKAKAEVLVSEITGGAAQNFSDLSQWTPEVLSQVERGLAQRRQEVVNA